MVPCGIVVLVDIGQAVFLRAVRDILKHAQAQTCTELDVDAELLDCFERRTAPSRRNAVDVGLQVQVAPLEVTSRF